MSKHKLPTEQESKDFDAKMDAIEPLLKEENVDKQIQPLVTDAPLVLEEEVGHTDALVELTKISTEDKIKFHLSEAKAAIATLNLPRAQGLALRTLDAAIDKVVEELS